MDIKFCKDCKFCKRTWTDFVFLFGTYRFAMCNHPRLLEVSTEHLVSGGKAVSSKYCSNERTAYEWLDVCGPEGKYFEVKK